MTKLSDLKPGDKFTVTATIQEDQPPSIINFKIDGAHFHNYMDRRVDGDIEVTKVPADLVKGQRIRPNNTDLEGDYLGMGWAWFDKRTAPQSLVYPATTEYYEVI